MTEKRALSAENAIDQLSPSVKERSKIASLSVKCTSPPLAREGNNGTNRTTAATAMESAAPAAAELSPKNAVVDDISEYPSQIASTEQTKQDETRSLSQIRGSSDVTTSTRGAGYPTDSSCDTTDECAKGIQQEVVVQFTDSCGTSCGSRVVVQLDTSRQQLQRLLCELQPSAEPQLYTFRIQQNPHAPFVEVTDTLRTALVGLTGLTSESVLSVVFFPLAVFRVAPVTRCTTSLEGHSEAVLTASFSPDGTALATGSGDTTVRLWDLNTETPAETLQAHSNWVMIVAWSADGKYLATAGMDKIIIVWESSDWKRRKNTLSGHTKGVTSVCWEPLHRVSDEQIAPLLASASQDCSIRIWDVILGRCKVVLTSHALPVSHIQFSGCIEAPRLYSCSRDTSLKIWDYSSGALVETYKKHAHWVNTLALNTARVMASGPFDHTEESRSIVAGHDGRLVARRIAKEAYLKFLNQSCGGKERVVTGSDDNTMILWEPLHKKGPVSRLTGHQRPVNHVLFSPNGLIIASGSFDKSIRLWDSTLGTYLGVLRGHVGAVYQISFSPDSNFLASASADSTVKVWDLKTKKLKEDLPGHADEVYCLDWSLDGGRVVSGSKDRQVKLWRN